METIDERSDAYIRENARQEGYDAEDVRTAYIDGAEAEHKLLTRWHDPEKTSPNNLQRVLVKYKKDGGGMGIAIATYHRPLCTGNGTFAFEVPPSQNIVGWRSIYE